jgi:hypothetical protein
MRNEDSGVNVIEKSFAGKTMTHNEDTCFAQMTVNSCGVFHKQNTVSSND